MRKVASPKSKGSRASQSAGTNTALAPQSGASIVCLETYRLTRSLAKTTAGLSLCVTTNADRDAMLAEICRSAAYGGHAGKEWGKVAEFLARQFQAKPIP